MSAVLHPDKPGSSPAPPPSAKVTEAIKEATEPSAIDRITESRMRLRAAMMEIAHPPKPQYAAGQNVNDIARNLLLRLKTLPGAALILDSLDSWWRQHPLRTAGLMAGEASKTLVTPMARRSPGTLLLAATGAGALFILLKPWRWLLRPALFVGLVPQIASHAMKRMPMDYWVQMMSSLARSGRNAPASRPATAAAATGTPASTVRAASTTASSPMHPNTSARSPTSPQVSALP
jgi:hypothetical protein